MHKKGDLSLSINAIVILILAITMLGLGLAFMRGTFGKVTSQFSEVSSEVQKDMIKRLESSGENLALSVFEIEVRQGESKEVYLAIRNDLDTETTFTIDKGGGDLRQSSKTCNATEATTHCCITMIKGSVCEDITVSTFPKVTLAPGQTQVMKVKVSVFPRAARDTYLMPIRVEAPATATSPPFDKTVRLQVVVK